MTTVLSFPPPCTDDLDTGGFWQAAARGELAVQWCARCSEPVHLPRPQCPRCGAGDLTWRDVRPRGSLYAWAVVRHQVHPDFPVPHTLILVELTDQPTVRLVGVLEGAPPLRAGDPMHATFPTLPTGETLVAWHVGASPIEGES